MGAGLDPLLVFLPLFPLFFDALATLVLRLRRREKITVAHRSHLYQRLAAGAGHAVVSASYGVAAAIGALLAASLKAADRSSMVAGLFGYAILTIAVWLFLHRRFPISSSVPTPF